MSDGMQTMKQGLRQSIIAARQKLAEAERLRFSQRITAHLVELPAYMQAEVVLGYMSFGAEFTTGDWVQRVLQDGKQLLLPRVNKQTRQLDVYRVRDVVRDVAPGAWDIPEPVEARCERIENLSAVDFILLPGVAFGRDGARLGYGGGFYDKLLQRMQQTARPALAAAAFAMQLAPDIPMEAFDRKVDWLVTESEVIDCSKM